MRGLVWASLLLLLPGVAAVDVGTDQTGDVTVEVGDQSTADPGRYDAVDLVSLTITELPDVFRFELEVADATGDSEVYIVDDTRYTVDFRHEDVHYRAHLFRALADQIYWWGWLGKVTENSVTFQDGFRPIAEDNTIVFDIARDSMPDSTGAAPFPGRSLTDVFAESHLRVSQGFFNVGGVNPGSDVDAWDRLPDSGFGAEVPVVLGLEQSGHAALLAPAPVRASNGEASTFVFPLIAQNHAEFDDVFELTIKDQPSTWNVVLPEPILSLGPGEEREVPVIVVTPFAHRHGSFDAVRIDLESTRDPNTVGRAEIGIRFHEIPQPAGHHDTLYLHSQRFGEDSQFFVITDNLFAGNSGFAYWNAAENDEFDQAVPITGTYQGYGCHFGGVCQDPVSLYRWWTFLQPGLEMGLDFDLSRDGRLDVQIDSQILLPQGVVNGRVMHWAYDDEVENWVGTTIAKLEPTAPADLQPGATHSVGWDLVIEPAADLISYREQAAFMVELNLTTPRPDAFTGAEAPRLLPGGEMQLPLFEYHDPVDDLLGTATNVAWEAASLERVANAGKTLVFEATLQNTGDTTAHVDLAMDGVNVQWARLSTGMHHAIPAGESAHVQVRIDVPESAIAGDRVDVVVRAETELGQSLLRLVAAVDPTVDVPDESAHVVGTPTTKDTPLSLLVGLAALAIVLRRKRA